MFTLLFLSLFASSAIAHSIGGYQELTPEQIERLNNWTEDDQQNIWQLSGQFEGDILLTPNQIRNGIINTWYRWTGGILPYIFDSSVTEYQRQSIRYALQGYNAVSCVKVTEITGIIPSDYVVVTSSSPGCFSNVGRIGGGQQLNLANGCYSTGTIQHEFLHALGFYHQQSATERDYYVSIMWNNIDPNAKGNFEKYGSDIITSFGEYYDYGSVMHYDAYAFSINGLKTIVTLDPNAVIGQRVGLSETDRRKLRKMYGC